jgi:nucleoid-associated protein YgaU
MYALDTQRAATRHWRLGRWQPGLGALWRVRWAITAIAAAALLAAGFAREAAGSSLTAGSPAAASQTVTVAPGDTLWGIASRRYPDADARRKVFEIEQLNGLSGPEIVAGERLRVPDR